MFKITLMTLNGRQISIPITMNTTALDVKHEICKKLPFPENDIKLFFRSKQLKDNTNIFDMKLKSKDFITIHQGDSYFSPLLVEQKFNFFPRATEGKPVPTYEEFHNIKSSYKEQEPIEEIKQEEEHIDLIESDPPGFEGIVKSIMEYGFDKERIIELLRKYNYDKSICIQVLSTGKEPQTQPKEIIYDVSDLSMYDFGEFGDFLDELTNHEKHDLLTLCKIYQDPMNIIQVFFACDKNMEAAEHALLE